MDKMAVCSGENAKELVKKKKSQNKLQVGV